MSEMLFEICISMDSIFSIPSFRPCLMLSSTLFSCFRTTSSSSFNSLMLAEFRWVSNAFLNSSMHGRVVSDS